MADTTTTNLGLTKPEVDVEDPSTDWGDKLNDNLDLIDAKFNATLPTAQIIGAGAAGSSTTIARADHVHPLASATPSTQAFGDAAVEGVATTVARSDHKHAMPTVNLSNLLALAGGTMVGPIAMSNQKITGLGAATANGDALRFEQMVVVQAKFATTATDFSTTSSTFQTSNLSATITPKSTSNKIVVIATANTARTGTNAIQVSVFRGTTNLATTYIGRMNTTVSQSQKGPITLLAHETAPSITALTYAVKVASEDNTSSVSFGVDSATQFLIVLEVTPS